MGEQSIADYIRKGFVVGRSLRLPTVSVRSGKSNAAASSFLSGIAREPLAGQAAVCPVPLDMQVSLLSLRGAMLEALRRVVCEAVVARIRLEVDAGIRAIVGNWPSGFPPIPVLQPSAAATLRKIRRRSAGSDRVLETE